MRAGLYQLTTIAEFLGQRPDEMPSRIKLDGLPAIQVPGGTKACYKVSLLAFHAWLADRTSGTPLTVDQLELELSRCADVVRLRGQQKAAKKLNKEAA